MYIKSICWYSHLTKEQEALLPNRELSAGSSDMWSALDSAAQESPSRCDPAEAAESLSCVRSPLATEVAGQPVGTSRVLGRTSGSEGSDSEEEGALRRLFRLGRLSELV